MILSQYVAKELQVDANRQSKANLFNRSLPTDMVPDKQKMANVISIYKVGERFLTLNFTPISLIITMEKLMELIIVDAIQSHHKRYNLINNSQDGYTKVSILCYKFTIFYI